MSFGCPLVAVEGNEVATVVVETSIVVVVGKNLANHSTMSGTEGWKVVAAHFR
jgi:hypothetical protein